VTGDLPTPDAVCDGGDLDCGSGLLLIIRDAMQPVPAGGVLEVRSREPTVREDLPAWCRMVGHALLGDSAADLRTTRYFIRKRQADGDLDAHLQQARDDAWKVRARRTDGMAATVYARNHQFAVGQPASFDTADAAPSAVELLLGALAGALVVGFSWRCSQRGIAVHDLEVSLSARAEDILVFLGVAAEGHPGFAAVTGRCFVDADGDDATLAALWTETVRRCPVAQTLARTATLDVPLRRG
jgi:TusA-related sulfurtransferase/uncharacterized OsmC-like protein